MAHSFPLSFPTRAWRRLPALFAACLALCTLSSAQSPTPASLPAAEKVGNTAIQPRPRVEKKHLANLERAKQGPVGLLFLGDSITEQWKKAPAVWEKYYASYQPANFGIGGDRTEHVLWRIQHGELDTIRPKVVVLMIGTNNSLDNSAAEILEGHKVILAEIRSRLPEAKVLLLAIFPRGPRKGANGSVDDHQHRMRVITEVNAALPGLADGKTVRFLNINHVFVQPDGTIPEDVMPDQLHLSPAAYERWAEAMQPTLAEMLRE